jgi:hypothetical protein
MLSDERLLLSARELAKNGQRGPVLLFLSQVKQPAQLSIIRDKAVGVGFREIKKWNIADVLLRAAKDGQGAQRKEGWTLLGPGLDAIGAHYKPEGAIVQESRHALKKYLSEITEPQRQVFIEEAIKSFDVGAHRAAIVLSWVGAVHLIQEHVVNAHKASFNAAGAARVAKAAASGNDFIFSPIKTLKDFGTIGEADFLQLCQDAGILHKAEKQQLTERLNLRNQCGHPNPLVVAEHVVASHIEILMRNVYAKY